MTDVVDARNASEIVVNGTLTTVSDYPFDGLAAKPNLSALLTSPNNIAPGYPYGASLPQYVDQFSGTGGMVAYGRLTELNPMVQIGLPAPNAGQVATNPLVAAFGATPDMATYPGCGGLTPVFASPPAGGFVPGVYTFPVDVTGSALAGPLAPTFASCPGGGPGTYIFEQGISIHPPSGQKVYGSNVLFVTQNPVADSVLTNNVGNGIPIGAVATDGWVAGTGLNLSVALGGTGTIDLRAPSSGQYKGLLLWQAQTDDSGATVRGNFGFNTAASDNATVTLQGIVGNTTMGESPLPPNVTDYHGGWHGPNTTIPWDAGGMLIGGVPILLGGTDPVGPQGSDTITGSAVVDTFLTQGNANTLVNAVASPVSGIVSPGGPRLVH